MLYFEAGYSSVELQGNSLSDSKIENQTNSENTGVSDRYMKYEEEIKGADSLQIYIEGRGMD